MTVDMPDPVEVAREAVFANADACQRLAVDHTSAFTIALWGARAMQAAMAGREVRDDYAAICKELGCIEKPGVPLRFIQEMRKNLTAARERIDWLLRSWDDATITERQELDRMRRGWGPTTPTERMLRHRDLRDCMQALSGALTDLTTPEDDNADPEVEARLQEAYDRVNKRYLASLEIIQRLDEPLERPDLEPAGAQEGAPLCDCERGHNGLGMAGRECDCTPTPAGAGDLVERGRKASAVVDSYTGDKCLIRDLTDRIEALEAEVARLTRDLESADEEINDLQSECSSHENDDAKLEARATAAEAERDALKAEVERLRRADMACRWYWPENSTESENCADSPQEVVQNAYGWEEPRGDVVAVARGGVVEVTYCAALPPAPDSDSDDEFWVEEATKEAATAKITAELERRAALSPAKAGG